MSLHDSLPSFWKSQRRLQLEQSRNAYQNTICNDVSQHAERIELSCSSTIVSAIYQWIAPSSWGFENDSILRKRIAKQNVKKKIELKCSIATWTKFSRFVMKITIMVFFRFNNHFDANHHEIFYYKIKICWKSLEIGNVQMTTKMKEPPFSFLLL